MCQGGIVVFVGFVYYLINLNPIYSKHIKSHKNKMEKQLEEIKKSLDSLHQRLDRLFYWTGYIDQESKIKSQRLTSKPPDPNPTPNPDPDSSPPSTDKDPLEIRLIKLKLDKSV